MHWRPSGDVVRTFWTISFTATIHSNSPQTIRIHEPLSHTLPPISTTDQKMNPIPRILGWKARLENEPLLTLAKIAEEENFSRVRIGQLLEITKLNKNILDNLQTKQQLDFSINQLRKLSRLKPDQQTRHFQTLQDSLCSH